MMSSQPDLPCGEEEEVDREEEKKGKRGENWKRVKVDMQPQARTQRRKQLKVQKLLEGFDKTLR